MQSKRHQLYDMCCVHVDMAMITLLKQVKINNNGKYKDMTYFEMSEGDRIKLEKSASRLDSSCCH